jgi:hypothetical protein
MDKPRVSKEDRLRTIVVLGIDILQEEKDYKQNQIINKLRTLNLLVSAASLSNVLTDKKVGLEVLKKLARGIQDIIQSELGYTPSDTGFDKDVSTDWKPILVKETNPLIPILENDAIWPGFTFHTEGRVSIQHKTDFFLTAQSEIIEVGTRLKTFSEYFFSRNEQEYKAHIVALLKRGVKMRFYMLDPASNEALLYFQDRAKFQEEEKDSINEMKKVLERVKKVHAEFEKEKFIGSFEVYLYKHLPTNHFFVVDGNLPDGKMMVSHYLFGLRRAECPVMEIDKRHQILLYKKYFKSLNLFIADAKRVIPASSNIL